MLGTLVLLGGVTVGTLIIVANTFLELVFIHSVATVGFARSCFVASFTLCGALFVSLLLELLGLLSRSTGAVVLGTCVTVLVIAVAGLLPYVALYSFLKHTFGTGTTCKAIVVALIAGAWFAISALASPCASQDDAAVGIVAVDAQCSGFMDRITALAALVGVCVVSVLGGYAILATPFSYVEPLVRWRAVAAAERSVQALCQRQLHILRMWATRRDALAIATATPRGPSSGGGGGLFGRLRNVLQDGGGGGASELAVECSGYAQVSSGVFLAMQDACERSAHTANIRSARGAIFGVYGVILAAYCAIKLVTTAVNLVLGRFSTVDPVTRALTILGLMGGDVQQMTGSTSLETLGLIFNAVMILSAIRGFLLLVFRLTCNNRAATPEASLLMLSLFMSFYFLGTAVLLRLSLPNEFRPQLNQAIGALPFRYYHWFHDCGMLLSAAVTAVVLRLYGGSEDLGDS